MGSMCSALVTGSTGSLGPALVQRLLSGGYRVRALVRSVPAAGVLPDCVELIPGDITDDRALQLATASVDVVFHLAAKLHISDPSVNLQTEYERVNVEGTRKLLEAAEDARVRRFIFFSTINVYGHSAPGSVLDEQSPVHPESYYAETKARAEELVLASGVPATVLRLAAVYGSRVKGNYAHLLAALRQRRFMVIGPGTNRRTLVYEQDVAEAALLAVEQEQARGKTYNVTDGTTHELNEIIQAMCLALGTSAPRLRLPAGPVMLIAGLAAQVYHLVGRPAPFGPATIDKLLEDVAVRGDEITRDLGFRPHWDIWSGWGDVVWRMRNGGF